MSKVDLTATCENCGMEIHINDIRRCNECGAILCNRCICEECDSIAWIKLAE